MKEVIMKALRYSVPSLLASTLLLASGTANAHFKLLSPDSWLTEAADGAPQKGGPCGPGGADDVQPVPMSMKVTEVHAGDQLMVTFDETIHHPGWFRIALDEDEKNFKDPDFPNANCTVDMSKVSTMPHDNVLADGLFMDSELTGANRQLKQMVTIPDKPCEKCTLQVIQVMADAIHSPPGCVYHHCAQLKILPKEGGGSAAAGSGGSTGGAAGMSASTAGSSAAAGSGGSKAVSEGAAGAMAAGGSSGGAGAKAAPSAAAGSGASASAGAAGKPAASTSGAAGSAAKPAGSSTAPKAGSAAPSTGSTTSSSTSSDGATGMTTESSGGCAVSGAGADANGASFALLSLVGLFLAGRRKRQ